MKVGFVVPKLSGGGAEYVAREWASYLANAKFEVTIFVTQAVEELEPASYSVVLLPSSGFLGKIMSLRSQIAYRGIDVVVGVMPYWNLLAIIAGKSRLASKTKVVLSSHTIESDYGAERGRGFVLQTFMARFFYRHADAFLASSHPVAAEAVARYSIHRDRLWVVPNPVFPEPIDRSAVTDKPSLARVGYRPILVVPGRLVDQKRPEVAIDVAAAIGRLQGASPEVWYVGDGPARESLKSRAHSAGVQATFMAWDSEWPSLVPPGSVVLLPSMLEGFGNVLIDAAAGGLPVVASSKALGVADAMIPGVTGVLVTGESVASYMDGVLRVRDLPSSNNQSVDRWLNRFTRDHSGAQVQSVISNLTSTVKR